MSLIDLTGKLGKHHFAHLRALAEGLDLVETAKRYLAIDHAAEAANAHKLVVARVRAVARRRGDSRWRLIGLHIAMPEDGQGGAAAPPALDEWAEAEGFDDWSQADLLEMYTERFDATTDPVLSRKLARNERLRTKRLAILRELEAVAAEDAQPTDKLSGWLALEMAQALKRAGMLTLGDLAIRIGQGGQWWKSLPAVGPLKARRLARHVEILLGSDTVYPVAVVTKDLTTFDGRFGANRVQVTAVAGLDAQDDRQAIQAWIDARASSEHTGVQYQRDAERFLLWCVTERAKALSDANVQDCKAYMEFLTNVPARWISRRKVARMSPGWAPFMGQLKPKSQRLAVTILHSMFAWPVSAGYLVTNPWLLINRRLGEDENAAPAIGGNSRAFTPDVWAALRAEVARDPSPKNLRLNWMCTFVASTGLRSAELLRATRGHVIQTRKGPVLQVHGKGRKNRVVPISSRALQATRDHFQAKGLAWESCSSTTPLLSALTDNAQPITYEALYNSFKRFIRRAIENSSLSEQETQRALQASNHWLRHTFGTRAAEGGMHVDVLQAILGHSDPRTSASYYSAQIERQQEQVELVRLDS